MPTAKRKTVRVRRNELTPSSLIADIRADQARMDREKREHDERMRKQAAAIKDVCDKLDPIVAELSVMLAQAPEVFARSQPPITKALLDGQTIVLLSEKGTKKAEDVLYWHFKPEQKKIQVTVGVPGGGRLTVDVEPNLGAIRQFVYKTIKRHMIPGWDPKS